MLTCMVILLMVLCGSIFLCVGIYEYMVYFSTWRVFSLSTSFAPEKLLRSGDFRFSPRFSFRTSLRDAVNLF